MVALISVRGALETEREVLKELAEKVLATVVHMMGANALEGKDRATDIYTSGCSLLMLCVKVMEGKVGAGFVTRWLKLSGVGSL